MNCISVKNLTFNYQEKNIFSNLNIDFHFGRCYVLAGRNGSGKSTLLRLIGGKMISPSDSISVMNKDPFRDTTLNNKITFINNDWGKQTIAFSGVSPLQSSLKVKEMMVKLKELYPERNKELIDLLKINPEWRLNAVSEGQRKRIQLYLNLIQPFDICLLDEITVNLDLLIKDKFMSYLKKESIERNSCIIYITHIFDGLSDWASDLVYLKLNKEIIVKTEIDKDKTINIYDYLLSQFKLEEKNAKDEQEDINIDINLKNAGGYTSGVLINL